LKEKIEKRTHPLVIRPDSGNPQDIICGTAECKGILERLWDKFGGTINDKGFKVLPPYIRVIYGDSITLDNLKPILENIMANGFCVTNMYFGVGSYTYQYNTRDTYGFAMKTTYIEDKNNKGISIFKEPKTDSGVKKSAKGLLAIINGKLIEEAT
jgi:nicotinamide phosphoribosyltransferase